MHKLSHKYLVPLFSLLPEWLLRKLGGWKLTYRIGLDPSDGWNFWLDASYWKYCRKGKRNNKEVD